MIATPRHELTTCAPHEQIGAVLEANIGEYDFIPVVARRGEIEKIVGLLNLSRHDSPHDGLVSDSFESLSEENLIGADASIIDFVRDAHIHQCRLVLSGREISGMVTLSDLQKLPVRAALFTFVTHLEMEMAAYIRRNLTTEEWFDCLPRNRQKKLLAEEQKASDMFVDRLLFTQIADKRTIISQLPAMLPRAKAFKRDLGRVDRLRNKLAHANEYADTPKRAAQMCKTVQALIEWVAWFEVQDGERPNGATSLDAG